MPEPTTSSQRGTAGEDGTAGCMHGHPVRCADGSATPCPSCGHHPVHGSIAHTLADFIVSADEAADAVLCALAEGGWTLIRSDSWRLRSDFGVVTEAYDQVVGQFNALERQRDAWRSRADWLRGIVVEAAVHLANEDPRSARVTLLGADVREATDG